MFSRKPDPLQELLVETLRESLSVIKETNERILAELARLSEAVVAASSRPAEVPSFQPLPPSEEADEIRWLRDAGHIDDDEMQRLLKAADLPGTSVQYDPSSYPRLSEVLDSRED